MLILVLNSGSSSIKFQLQEVIVAQGGSPMTGVVLVRGGVRRIGGTAMLDFVAEGGAKETLSRTVENHAQALRWLFEQLEQVQIDGSTVLSRVGAVGHRVVHGGERFTDATVITEEVEKEIDALCDLAPLHNPACLEGIRAARALLGGKIPMVAVFDTAFHRTMPAPARMYALPYELATRHRVWRYGFHGLAHASLAAGYERATGRSLAGVRLITLQLGNGCSATAIAYGRSVETSMGFTPLEGLVMGTRSGDLDPSVLTYLAQREQVEPQQVEQWLNEQSGLLGVSGRTNDMRELLRADREEQDERARLAIALFCHRVRKYLGAYMAVLGGADAIVFGGGIGENSPEVRSRICDDMGWCGLKVDEVRNAQAVSLAPGEAAQISEDGCALAAYVVAADEETWIASETARCLTRPLMGN